MWTVNLQMIKLDLEKGDEPEVKLPTSVGPQEKQDNAQNPSSEASFNNTWTKNFQTYKLDLEKADVLEIKLPTPIGS